MLMLETVFDGRYRGESFRIYWRRVHTQLLDNDTVQHGERLSSHLLDYRLYKPDGGGAGA